MNNTNPKLIGLITAWGAEDWIIPALNQAVEYCDEVFVCVSAHSENLIPFEDSTNHLANLFPDIKLVEFSGKSVHSETKARILNEMLKQSRLFSPGNWIWILDVDEFYSGHAYNEIVDVLFSRQYDHIRVEEKFFFIDMKHYLDGSHTRLFKIKYTNILPWCRFRPTQRWGKKLNNVYVLPRQTGMFHYSLLTNINLRKAQWQTEYPHTRQKHKIKWLEEVYLHYDLENQQPWIDKNFELFNIRSPWFNSGFTADEDGRLFIFNGKHPSFIQESQLVDVNDFRDFYG